jgi:omega-6 fatty acid desaturase (delta-12 desaturase)
MSGIRELQQAKITSLHPKDIWACLRLKVWDPEQQKMIGYREIF